VGIEILHPKMHVCRTARVLPGGFPLDAPRQLESLRRCMIRGFRRESEDYQAAGAFPLESSGAS